MSLETGMCGVASCFKNMGLLDAEQLERSATLGVITGRQLIESSLHPFFSANLYPSAKSG